MKRVTPSFTVEYRQAKRPNTGSAKLGWAHAQPAPEVAEKGSWVAISAFKTTAAHSPAEVVSPSIPRGRILPSLLRPWLGPDRPRLNGPNRGVEGAPRKQVVPRKYRETGQWLVCLEGTYILPKTASRWWQ